MKVCLVGNLDVLPKLIKRFGKDAKIIDIIKELNSDDYSLDKA